MYPFDNSFWGTEHEWRKSGVDKVLRSVAQVAGLIHLPQSFFWELAIQCWGSPEVMGFPGSIVFNRFLGILIRNSIKSFQASFSDFGEKVEHNPCSGIEISDGEFSENQIRQSVTETELLDSPFSPESMITLTSMILINVIP